MGSFNRTLVELKYDHLLSLTVKTVGFNRTLVELKLLW